MCKSENIIELKDVRKVFDDETVAVECFNLEVKKGEFVTFLSANSVPLLAGDLLIALNICFSAVNSRFPIHFSKDAKTP